MEVGSIDAGSAAYFNIIAYGYVCQSNEGGLRNAYVVTYRERATSINEEGTGLGTTDGTMIDAVVHREMLADGHVAATRHHDIGHTACTKITE